MAGRLIAAGAAHVAVSPLLEIRVGDVLPALAEGLILTSPNGVAAYGALDGPAGRPTWCVGPQTAARATALGLDVRGTAPDAISLAAAIPGDAPPLLHLRGRHQRGDLAGALRVRGVKASEAVIYDQVAIPLSDAALALVAAGPVLAPIYSPRTAGLLAAAVGANRWNVRAICLSAAVAEATSLECVAVASRPDGDAMERTILETLATIGG